MATTLKDVAERANVSSATASRVFNNHPNVNDTVRDTVRQAALDLGYTAGTSRRAEPIIETVLLMGGIADSLYEDDASFIGREFTKLVAAGAQSVLEEHGILTRVQAYAADLEAIRAQARSPGIMGLILLGGNIEHLETARVLRQSGVPAVIAGGFPEAEGVSSVSTDYLHGMELAVNHLAQAGRRRVGLVNGPATTSTSLQKYKGLRMALALRDLPFISSFVVESAFTSSRGYASTLELLQAAPDLDAIIYADDYMAMGGLRALDEQGRRVPEDVAVVGFHDYEIADFTTPPLTTIGFDMHAMGKVAAQRVLMLKRSPHAEDWHVLLPTRLVVRTSG